MHHITFLSTVLFTLFFSSASIHAQNASRLPSYTDSTSLIILEKRPSRVGLGISLGGSGLLGIPLRVQAGKIFFLEAGIHHRPVVAFTKKPFSIYAIEQSLLFSGGFNILKSLHWKPKKNVYSAGGFAVHAGRSIPYQTTFASVGMIWERMRPKKSNRSFIFEAGLAGSKDAFWTDAPFYGAEEDNRLRLLLYWKCHWNHFLKTK